MALYQIETPDGKLFQIEGPKGASHDELIAQVQQYQRPSASDRLAELRRRQREALRAPAPEPEVETTFGGNVKEAFKGLVPGAVGLAETAGTGIAALLPEDTEKAAREKIKELAGIAKKPFEASKGYEESVGRKLGEGLGSTLPFFALGPAGFAGRVAGAGLGVAAGAGEARESAEAKGATGEERRMATLLGAPTGLLDIIAPEIGPMKSLITTALARGGMEGATEAAQKIAQNLIAKGVYDPSQPVLAGSGEEGAYGAGVGALASLIIDLTVGRKARTAKFGEKPAPAPTETPAATAPAETRAPTAEMPQGELFPGELSDAQKALADVVGPAKPEAVQEETKPVSLRGVPESEQDTVRGLLQENFKTTLDPETGDVRVEAQDYEAARQLLADVGVKAPDTRTERDTETRDMISEMETADVERMVEEDKSAELRKLMEQDKAEAKKARLKLESDIAELDGQIKAKQEKTSQDKRLELLLPIVESDVQNIPKAFVQTLKREGYSNPNLTERERNLINRVYDLRLAEEPTPVTPEEEPSAPAENAAMEALIPEKTDQREPEQMGFPGMGKPKGKAPEAFSEEEVAAQEKPFDTVLTPEVLDKTGLPKQSGFYKQLLNMDMADAAQQPIVANIFTKVRQNPNVTPTTKQAIERMAMQAFGGLAKQQELFPEGKKGAKKPAKEKPSEPAAKRDQVAGTDKGTTGTRPEGGKPVVSKPATAERPAGAKSTEKPEPTRLGDSGQPVRDAGKRKGVEPSALTETKTTHRVTYDGKPATVTIIRTAEDPTKIEAVTIKVDGEKFAAVNLGKQGVVSDEKMLDNLVETEAIESKTEPKPAPAKAEPKPASKTTGDLGAYAGLVESDEKLAIESLAHDLYMASYPQRDVSKGLNEITAALVRGEMPPLKFGREGSTDFYPGTGGKYAKAFFESLTPAQQTELRKKLEHFFITAEAQTRQGMDWFNAKQTLDREVQKQMDADEELTADAVRAFAPLHPNVLSAIKAGDVVGALTSFAGKLTSRNAKIARALAKALDGVKIEIVDDLKSPSGRALAGSFDPKTNTIKLDSKVGLNAHALLHEAVHAATLNTLSNKSHPVTKQLTELFNNVKGSLDTAYGTQSLEDFVSEAFSNPEFQQKLAQINPKGEPISALRRFVNAVGNFMRRLVGMNTKGLNSALDATDVAAMQIIAPGMSLGGSLYQASMLGTGKEVFGALDDQIIKMPMMDNAFVGRFYEILRQKIPTTSKTILLRSLPLNALVEVASKDIPMAQKLDILEKKWNGAIDERRRAVDATMHRINQWVKGNPDRESVLDNVVMKSTLEEVDPSKSRDSYKGKTSKSGKDKQAVWDELQSQWKALGAEGQTVYKQMRDSYAESHEKLLDLLFKRIEGSVKDPAEAKKLRTEVYQRLAVKGKIEPYFPLMRQGDYWVTFNAKDANGQLEYYKMAFRTSVERDRAIRELKADPNVELKSVQKSTPTGKRNYKDAPPTSFVNNILKVLEANKVSEDVSNEIMRVYLDALPESSFAQSFRARLGTLGAMHNSTGVFYSKSLSMAHQLANLEYGAQMYGVRDEMQKHVEEKNRTESARMLFDTLDRHIKSMVSPDVAPWAKTATSAAFGFTLGFNVSSALVNLTQLPMVVAPYLGGKYGYGQTNKAVGAATRLFFQSGLKRKARMVGGGEEVELKAGYSLDNYDFNDKKLSKDVLELKELSDLASSYGLLSRSQTSDVLESGAPDSVLAKINGWSGFVFHHGERMNRQVAMIAAYRLELDRMRKGGKELTAEDRTAAAHEAIRLTELLNGGASANSAPLLAKNSLGKMVFMYKRYGVSMYYMMFKTAQDAMVSEDPEVRKAAKRQIAGIYATSAMLAGVQGIPMFGVAAALYNLFLKGDDDDDMETAARKYMGEGMFNGALNYFTGTAIANRIGLTDLLLHDTGYRNQDNAVLSFLQLAGGPVYGVADRLTRGAKLIMDGETQRGLEQMAPAAVGNLLKGARFLTEGANTMRGDPIVGEIGVGHSLAQMFGFAPAEYTRQLEVNASAKNIERRVLQNRTDLLRKFYIATRSGDSDAAKGYMDELVKLGSKHPGLVTAETILRSMQQHMKTSAEMYHGVTLNKAMRQELMNHASEFDSDVSVFTDDGE